jgi:D-lactate dehydrogenase
MKLAIFSAKNYEKPFLDQANGKYHHLITYFETELNEKTALLARGFDALSVFVNDDLNATLLKQLVDQGTKLIALRSAGFNNVDVEAAKSLGLPVVRVPNYSPYAVAEFAVGLILNLNRKIHRAYNLVREHNFLLTGLLGFDLHGKTVGVIGTGKIGAVFAKIMLGFGCRVLAFDLLENEDCKTLGVSYVVMNELLSQSDIISLHCPLTSHTKHIIDEKAITIMKDGVMLINTGRGQLVNTKAIINALKKQKIGSLGLDVYEEEENLFFRDLSDTIIQDDLFLRLQTFPNVIITGHQAFFTKEALINIANTTLSNIASFEKDPQKTENLIE